MKKHCLVISTACAAALAGCASPVAQDAQASSSIGTANPATQYCVDVGGTPLVQRDGAGGEAGICQLPDGTAVDEWALFRQSQQATPQSRTNVVDYRCDHDRGVRVTYFVDRERAVLERDSVAIELTQQPSASGFIYSNGPNTIRGKGDALTLEIGRMAPIQCQAE